jgi:AraC-like DNA-binding protein/mannose-6-phosphate isomerase-like protein (cupin superfamily)
VQKHHDNDSYEYIKNDEFHYSRKLDEPVKITSFPFHNHDTYEIYVFLEGNVHYFVEGSLYKLQPYDILVMKDNEMHRAIHMEKAQYHRIVINIKKNFFEKYLCKEYEKIFTDRNPGKDNIIKAEYTKASGLIDAIIRFESYTKESTVPDAVASALLIEILHILNKSKFENSIDTVKNEIVKKTMQYINENIENIDILDEISGYLFVSKSYLCRAFKKTTGMTINSYITAKRLMIVKQLCQSGKKIGEASVEAGFGSYSNFYKAYIKDTGLPPKEGLGKFIEQGKQNKLRG